ncbi:MAG: hypothetical protein EOM30_08950 [Clostridia bacterium]|nr:hypothetical protein [Clostridia bacterium]
MENISHAQENLNVLRRKVQVLYVLHTIIYAAALVLLLLNLYAAGMAVGVANMLIYFVYLRRQLTAYSDAVARVNVIYGLCSPLQNVEYTDKKGISEDKFNTFHMLPLRQGKGSSLSCRHAFSGRYGNMQFSGCEMTLHYPFKGQNNRVDYRFLNGTLLAAENFSKQETACGWLILCKNMLEPSAEKQFLRECGYHEAEVNKAELGEKLAVYTQEADGVLNADMTNRLAKLAKSMQSLAAVRLMPDKAVIYLGNRFFTRRTKVRILPDEAALCQNPLAERDDVFSFFRWWAEN